MYQNILKKAAAQQKAIPDQPHGIAPKNEQSREKSKMIRPAWQKYMGLAACLALVLVGTFALRSGTDQPSEDNPAPVLVGSPIQDVSGPEDFAPLDIELDAPEDAADVSYYILDSEIARVDFTLDGHRYTYSASRVDGDFSGVNGTVKSSSLVDAEHGTVLEQYDSGTWNACWKNGDMTFYLTNDDGTEEDTMTSLIQDLISQLP